MQRLLSSSLGAERLVFFDSKSAKVYFVKELNITFLWIRLVNFQPSLGESHWNAIQSMWCPVLSFSSALMWKGKQDSQNSSGGGLWNAIYWKGGTLSSLSVSQDFLKHKVCTGTRAAKCLWSERDCLMVICDSMIQWPSGDIMYVPVGFRCAEHNHLSVSWSVSSFLLELAGQGANIPVLSLCQPGVRKVDIWMRVGLGSFGSRFQPCWGAAAEEEQQSSLRCLTAFLLSYVETAKSSYIW